MACEEGQNFVVCLNLWVEIFPHPFYKPLALNKIVVCHALMAGHVKNLGWGDCNVKTAVFGTVFTCQPKCLLFEFPFKVCEIVLYENSVKNVTEF